LWFAFTLLVVYGSLLPFDLTGDATNVYEQRQNAWVNWPFDPNGPVGRSDIITNVLLYIPFGLLGGTRLSMGRWRRFPFPVVAFAITVVVGSALSASLEMSQSYSHVRVTSAQDWLTNTIGTAIGALVGILFGRIAWTRLRRSIRLSIRMRPVFLACAVMILMLAGDALYPLMPTIDVGNIKDSIKETLKHVRDPLAAHAWHSWLVNNVMVFAALAAMLSGASRREGTARYVIGALAAIGVAVVLEAGKTFIESRFSNPGNVLMSSLGAIVGGLLAAKLSPRLSDRGKAWTGLTIVTLYMLYQQLVPYKNKFGEYGPPGSEVFEWDISLLPLWHYYQRCNQEDVRLFCYNILVTAGILFAVNLTGVWKRAGRVGRMWRSALLAGCVGTGIELLQFFIPGRVPSTTDIFCYTVGGALGGWVYYRMHQRAYLGRPVDPDEIPEAVEV